MKETKFNPSEVKCLSNTLLIEVYIKDTISFKTDSGDLKTLSNGNSEPEPYGKVLSVGPQCEDLKPGDYILLKPLRKALYKIQDNKYTFINYFDIEAVVPEEYLTFFSVKNQQTNKPKDLLG